MRAGRPVDMETIPLVHRAYARNAVATGRTGTDAAATGDIAIVPHDTPLAPHLTDVIRGIY